MHVVAAGNDVKAPKHWAIAAAFEAVHTWGHNLTAVSPQLHALLID